MTQTQQQQQQTNSPFMTVPHDVSSSWSTTSSSRAAAALVPCHAVGEYDVLSGRGGATNNHSGNKRFRALVSTFRAEYLQARKKDKVLIARRIVDAIRQQGGRFLKRYDNNEEGNVNNNTNNNNNSNNTIVWIDVGDKRATEKTSQALREGLDVRNHTIRGGNGGQQQQQQQQRRRRQGATTATKKQPGHVRRESDSTTSSSWSSSYYSSPTKHHHPATNYFDQHHRHHHHHHVVIGDVSVMTAAAAMVPTFAPGSPAVVSLPGGDFATNSAATTAATNRIIPELFLPHPGTAAANDNNNNNTIIYPERKISQSDCDAVVAL